MGICFLLKLLPFEIMKAPSTLEAKVETKRKIKEKYEERTTKLLSITDKLLERNESAFSLSLEQFKEALNKNNNVSNLALQQILTLQQNLNHFHIENPL